MCKNIHLQQHELISQCYQKYQDAKQYQKYQDAKKYSMIQFM